MKNIPCFLSENNNIAVENLGPVCLRLRKVQNLRNLNVFNYFYHFNSSFFLKILISYILAKICGTGVGAKWSSYGSFTELIKYSSAVSIICHEYNGGQQALR